MTTPAVDHADKFAFVQSLAARLSSGSIELPSFPEVVIRLRQVLEDEQSTLAQIVQLLAAEPALAARLLQISNSAALRPGASPVTDLKVAVNRLGRSMVRNAAMSFAMKQMRAANRLESAQAYLEQLWHESTLVAALCYVLAKKFSRINPDEALLVGLLHGIGKLYILGQAETHPGLFKDATELEEILQEWHGAIGGAILESWRFPEAVSSSVANYQQLDRDHEGPTDLTDILILGHLLAGFLRPESDAELNLGMVPASRHLSASAEDFIGVIKESEDHIASLQRALAS